MEEKVLQRRLEMQGSRARRHIGVGRMSEHYNCERRLPGEVMFLLEDTAVVIMDTGKTDDGKEDFLDECIRILRGLLSELTEDADQEEGILMLQPGLWLDEKRHSVWEEDQEISVTRREYDVLYMLFRHKDCVLSYEQIYTNVWKEEYCEGRNSVICLMSRLRKKLKRVTCIRSIREIGYMYQAS